MALYYNNTNVANTFDVLINNKASSQVFFNNVLVWKKAYEVFPGTTWGFAVNQSDGGSGSGAQAYQASMNTMVLIGGYNGSSALCAKWVDITTYSTLSFTFSTSSLSYFQLRWGVYSAGTTNILGANEVRVTKTDGASGNYTGTHQINVSDLSGGVYLIVYLYAGSSLAANEVDISSVVLT